MPDLPAPQKCGALLFRPFQTGNVEISIKAWIGTSNICRGMNWRILVTRKEGKKRMKRIGRVEIPQEALLAVLKVGEDSD